MEVWPEIPVTAERALLLAILERSIVDAVFGIGGIPPQKQREAMQWIKFWHPEDLNTPFTFLWICSHLGICPHKVKAITLEAMKVGSVERFLAPVVSLVELLESDCGVEHRVGSLE